MRPGEFVVRRYHGHAFEIVKREPEGALRWDWFAVRCVVCGEVIRERTSSPLTWVRGHILSVGPVAN